LHEFADVAREIEQSGQSGQLKRVVPVGQNLQLRANCLLRTGKVRLRAGSKPFWSGFVQALRVHFARAAAVSFISNRASVRGGTWRRRTRVQTLGAPVMEVRVVLLQVKPMPPWT
jgi:hypothetical protein